MTTNLLIVEDGGMLAANLSVVIADLGYGALNGMETAAIIPGRSDVAIALLAGFVGEQKYLQPMEKGASVA